MNDATDNSRRLTPRAMVLTQLPILGLISLIYALSKSSHFGAAIVFGSAILALGAALVSALFGMRQGMLSALLVSMFFLSSDSAFIDGLDDSPARFGLSALALASAALFGTARKFRTPETAAIEGEEEKLDPLTPPAEADEIMGPVLPMAAEPAMPAMPAEPPATAISAAEPLEAPAPERTASAPLPGEAAKKEEFMDIARREISPHLERLEKNISQFKYYLERSDDEKARSYIAKIENHYRKLDRAMQDLFQFARIDFDSMPMKIDRFDIEKLCAETIEAVQRESDAHTIVFLPSASGFASGDRFKVRKVLDHLLRNAIKYSPKGGKVIVGLNDSGDTLTAFVRDFGIGIEEEHLGQMNEAFRLPAGSRATRRGLGIGLYTANAIVRRLGGEMRADGRKGKGSVFFFSVPRSHAEERQS